MRERCPVCGKALESSAFSPAYLGILRFMSEALVPTNLIGNAVATIVVSKWEGALDEAKMRSVLAGESEVEAEEPEKVLA